MMKKFTLKTRLIAPIFGLIFILLFLGTVTILSYYDKIRRLEILQTKINFNNLTSDLMHSLQKERGLSSGYLAGKNSLFEARMRKQRDITDKIYKEVRQHLQSNTCGTFAQSIHPYLFSYSTLQKLRQKIDKRTISSTTLIKAYSQLNRGLLNIIVQISKESHIPTITNDIIAFAHFLFMKEYTGIERAQGVVIISHFDFNRNDLLKFSNLTAKQEENEMFFLKFSSLPIKNYYKKMSQKAVFAKVANYERNIILIQKKNIDPNPLHWYDTITKKIEIFDQISNFIQTKTKNDIHNEISEAKEFFNLLLFLVFLSLIIFFYMLKIFLRLLKDEWKLREVMNRYIIYSITDPRGVITDVSDAFCDISGYKREELVGKPHNIVRHPDMPKEVFKELWENLKQGKPWRGKIKNLKHDGSYYWVYANIEPLYNSKGEIESYMAIRLDITEAERLQEKILEEEEKNRIQEYLLQQQHRLAQMGEMLSMIAHQWRQPLSAITAAAGSLSLKAKLGKSDPETVHELAEKIKGFSLHLSSTIDDFRNFFKSDKQAKRTDFKKLVDGVLQICENSLKKHNIEVDMHIQEVTPLLTYDNEMKQVLLNLIKNAEDVLMEREVENPRIEILIDKTTLTVKDNAGGIPEEIIDNIFDPYFSTKLKKDGTGLGLYMSKVIVEDHCGGTLRAYNDDEGAVFEITLQEEQEA